MAKLPQTRRARWPLAAALLCLAAACSSSTTSSGPSGTSDAPPSCSDACAHVGSVCGQTPTTCASSCANWSDSTKTCVGNLSACADLQACTTSGATDGGTSGTDAGKGDTGTGTPNELACSPYGNSTNTGASGPTCASGCQLATANDSKSIWCLKRCTGDAECGTKGACRKTTAAGNPMGCFPTCVNDTDCSSGGWGTCIKNTKFNYCSGGPDPHGAL